MRYAGITLLFALAALQNSAFVSAAPQAKGTDAGFTSATVIKSPPPISSLSTTSTVLDETTPTVHDEGSNPSTTDSTGPPTSGSASSSTPVPTVQGESPNSSAPGSTGTTSIPEEQATTTSSAPNESSTSTSSTTQRVKGTLSASTPQSSQESPTTTSSSSSTSIEQPTTTIALPAVPIDTTSSPSTVQESSTQVSTPASSTISGVPVPTLISTTKGETEARTFNFQKSLNTSLNDQGTKLTVQVTSSNAGQEFRGDFNVQTEGAFHASANFYRRQNDTESFFKLRAGLLKFVELNSAVEWNLTSSGNVINFANLSSNYWSPIKISDVPNDKNVEIKSISTTFSMQHPNQNNLFPKKGNIDGAFATIKEVADGEEINANITVRFEAFMVNDTVTLDNVIHTPKSLKYSLKISNFPFVYSDSQLAMVKGVYFKKGEETNYSSAASSLSIAGGKGHFNWTNAITLDSLASTLSTDSSITVEDVPDSNPQESVAHVVFRTNGTFDSLVWDPEVILDENRLVESYNQTGAGTKSGVVKLFSAGSSLVVMTVVSVALILLNGF